MTTLVLSDLLRDQACIGELALARYRDEACKEVMEANRPRLLRVLEDVKPAVAKVLEQER